MLDVLVEFDGTIGMFGLMATERCISDLLGVQVDLVMKQSLNRRIGRVILEAPCEANISRLRGGYSRGDEICMSIC